MINALGICYYCQSNSEKLIRLRYGQAYSETSETSEAKVFAKIVLIGFSR